MIQTLAESKPVVAMVNILNLFALGFKWLQSTFAYDILFAGNLNFSTGFTTNINITGTKED